MESLYKLVEKLISYLYTILLNKLCATDQNHVSLMLFIYNMYVCGNVRLLRPWAYLIPVRFRSNVNMIK